MGERSPLVRLCTFYRRYLGEYSMKIVNHYYHKRLSRSIHKMPFSKERKFLCVGIVAIVSLAFLSANSSFLFFRKKYDQFRTNYLYDKINTSKTEEAKRMLSLYSEQWRKYSHARFIPETYDQHLGFRIRFDDLIRFNTTRAISHQNVTIICRELSDHKRIWRFSIALSIVNRTVVSIELDGKVIKPDQSTSPSVSTNLFVLHLPLMITHNVSYAFSFQSDSDSSQIALDWPVWPLSSECIEQYSTYFITNPFRRGFCLACSLTSHFTGLAHKQIFQSEANSLSEYLDILYTASNVSQKHLHRRKHAFEGKSNTSFCSREFQDWVHNYKSWHANISRLISQPNQTVNQQRDLICKLDIRFLFMVRFESGTSDRLLHLVTSYLVAILTGRFYVFDDTWPEFLAMTHSSLAFRPQIVTPWRFHLHYLNENLTTNHSRYLSSRWQTTRSERCYSDYNYEKMFPERVLFLKSQGGNVMQMLTSPKSVYRNMLVDALKMRPDNIFGCLYHSLIIPRLSLFIEATSTVNTNDGISSQTMLQTLLLPQFVTIGLQIRIGDTYLKERISSIDNDQSLMKQFGGFFACAENITYSSRQTVVFLLADSFAIRRIALKEWPFYNSSSNTRMRLMTSLKQVQHISFTHDTLNALRDALFDMFLYSLCDRHIFTLRSGFGRIPAFASLRGQILFTLKPNDKPVCSRGDGQVNFTQSGHHWSGI